MLFLPLLLKISRLLVAFACPVSYFFTRAAFSFQSFLACVSDSSFAFLSFFFALALSIVFRCPPEVVDVPSHFIIFFAWRTNVVHPRFWIEYVFQLSPCFETVAPASFDNGSRFPGGVFYDVRMQGFVVRCLHDVCACCGCCVNCVVSSSFCPFQRCRAPCLSGSENSSDVVAPVVISVASDLLDFDFMSCEELLLLWLRLLQAFAVVSYPLKWAKMKKN